MPQLWDDEDRLDDAIKGGTERFEGFECNRLIASITCGAAAFE